MEYSGRIICTCPGDLYVDLHRDNMGDFHGDLLGDFGGDFHGDLRDYLK